jgi:hypothetical protein
VPATPRRRPAARRGGGVAAGKLSNYLIDKRLQLRYVLVVTLVSALIAGTLGFLIYQQEHDASAKLVAGPGRAGRQRRHARRVRQREFAADIAQRDRTLVLQMVGVGLGLTVILSGFLLIMTHKVAGPALQGRPLHGAHGRRSPRHDHPAAQGRHAAGLLHCSSARPTTPCATACATTPS